MARYKNFTNGGVGGRIYPADLNGIQDWLDARTTALEGRISRLWTPGEQFVSGTVSDAAQWMPTPDRVSITMPWDGFAEVSFLANWKMTSYLGGANAARAGTLASDAMQGYAFAYLDVDGVTPKLLTRYDRTGNQYSSGQGVGSTYMEGAFNGVDAYDNQFMTSYRPLNTSSGGLSTFGQGTVVPSLGVSESETHPYQDFPGGPGNDWVGPQSGMMFRQARELYTSNGTDYFFSFQGWQGTRIWLSAGTHQIGVKYNPTYLARLSTNQDRVYVKQRYLHVKVL